MKNLKDIIKNTAKKAVVGAGILASSLLYSGNVNAQNNSYEGKPEKAQKFSTALIGGKEVQVDLSEYVGSSYLSVPSEGEFGHEFYPWDALRSKDGTNSKGEVKDTLEVVHWKARGNYMEDLKSDIIYEAQKLDGKYLVHLMNKEEDDVLGLEISESTTTKEGDVITGTLKYESGKIEDVIRTVQFPGEDNKYFLLYRDQSVDSSGVGTGKKTPFVFLKVCEDNEHPLYFSGNDVFLEGEMYEFVATGESDLKKIQDSEGNSVLYNDSYLKDNSSEINEIRMSDRAQQDRSQKKGIPGHVKELLEEGEPCGENGRPKPKKSSGLGLIVRPEVGYSLVDAKGLEARIILGLPIAQDQGSLGLYGEGFLQSKESQATTNIPDSIGKLNGVNIYLKKDNMRIEDKRVLNPEWGVGVAASYSPEAIPIEMAIRAGIVKDKMQQELSTYGTISLLDGTQTNVLSSSSEVTTDIYDFDAISPKGALAVNYFPFKNAEKGPKGLYVGANGSMTFSQIQVYKDANSKTIQIKDKDANKETIFKKIKPYGSVALVAGWKFYQNKNSNSRSKKAKKSKR